MKIKRREGEPTRKKKRREGEPTKNNKRRALRVDDDREYNHKEAEEDDQDVFDLQKYVRDLVVEALEEHEYNIAEAVGVLTSEIKFVVDEYEDD